jgi:cob(I)alamin adenosyltransferase
MPNKTEIKANQKEARELKQMLNAKQRTSLKEAKAHRTIIRKAERKIALLELQQDLLTKKINRRLAILEGRNNA